LAARPERAELERLAQPGPYLSRQSELGLVALRRDTDHQPVPLAPLGRGASGHPADRLTRGALQRPGDP
jgi:hypothetical protein